MFKFSLGIKVKDRITGFKGVLVSRCDHITGCNTYGVLAEAKDDASKDARWFDELRLDVISRSPIVLDIDRASQKTGSMGIPQPSRTHG